MLYNEQLWLYMENLSQETIKELKGYFEQNHAVMLAFVFGSYAENLVREESDLDIAVYLKDILQEDRIWQDVSRITEKEVDLILLNEAPATLTAKIFHTGIPLVIRDRNLYWNLYLTASIEAEDFAIFSEDYRNISRRAKSLAPEDRARLIERLQFLEMEFGELESFRALTYKEYLDDKVKRRNIERWVENLLNATIDIAKLVLASHKALMPRTYEQTLREFGVTAGLSEEISHELAGFARLRNILAHEYLDILYSRIRKFLEKAPQYYPVIFKFLEDYLAKDADSQEAN